MYRTIALCVLIVLGCCEAAAAETRVALVIGNANYAHAGRLANPANDAEAVAQALHRIGFTVTKQTDLGKVALDAALHDFADVAAGADVAMIYYAGHGMEIAGTNYLIPVDARLANGRDAAFETVSLDLALHAVEGARRLKLVVLDACRDNPFAAQMAAGARGIGRGLARVEPEGDTLVAYAAKAGTEADDGAGNSPFAAAFARDIQTPGLDVRLMFGKVRDDVLAATNHRQEPFVYGSLGGENFYLVAPQGGSAVPAIAQPADPQAAEIAFWNSVAGSNDAAQFGAYLRKYPDGIYADLARTKIAALKAPPQQVAAIAPQRPAAPQANANVGNCQVASNAPAGCVFRDCPDICPEMVIIPPGSFTMGSPATEPGRSGDEGPQHTVTIGSPFAAGKYDVTFAQWDACVAAGGCSGYRPEDQGWGRSTMPVINVSWDDANAYAAWLSRKTGQHYRLLSESEWEYAARAGTQTPFYWGDTASHDDANYGADTCCSGLASGRDQWTNTSPVGSFAANGFGLYDMLGNVWQWTGDCYNANYAGAPAGGDVWTSGDCTLRVLRGGSWYNSSGLFHSANRFRMPSTVRSSQDGFRVARTL